MAPVAHAAQTDSLLDNTRQADRNEPAALSHRALHTVSANGLRAARSTAATSGGGMCVSILLENE
jgi:hypothetical protein